MASQIRDFRAPLGSFLQRPVFYVREARLVQSLRKLETTIILNARPKIGIAGARNRPIASKELSQLCTVTAAIR